MNCSICDGKTRKYGRNKGGQQRFRCNACEHTFIEHHKEIRIPRDKALLCLNLLVEGSSIRSTERITGIHRDTILHLLSVAGARCERVMEEQIKDIDVGLIEADEIWAFIKKKEGHKRGEEKADTTIGDAWTFVAIEATTKLVACYHLGRRDIPSATTFMQKLQRASNGRFQLTTDGLAAYREAVDTVFGADIDFAQLVKKYLTPLLCVRCITTSLVFISA